jgi:hypothetical protein
MRSSIFAVSTLVVAACASHPTQPALTGAADPAAPAAPPKAAAQAIGAPATPPEAAEAYDDPTELHDPEVMKPLFTRETRPKFPKATASDHDCWQTIQLQGDAKKDFASLVEKCGAPTGSVQYVEPVIGKLHHIHDKRDTFNVKIQGGLCYRFFGVADGSIQDLDILIERANGDLVGDDRTNGPVAIIEADKNWCMDTDGDFRFKVEVDGTGTGNYAFGVWARPKP